MAEYKPVDGATDQQNLIIGLFFIANELKTLNKHVEEGLIVYNPK